MVTEVVTRVIKLHVLMFCGDPALHLAERTDYSAGGIWFMQVRKDKCLVEPHVEKKFVSTISSLLQVFSGI